MANRLEVEKGIFDANIKTWRQNHMGEYVLIKGGETIGFYLGLKEASEKGMQLFGLEDFLISRIVPEESVNVTFLGQRMSGAGG